MDYECILCERYSGKLIHHNCDDKKDIFIEDFKKCPHCKYHHFMCKKCNKIRCFSCPYCRNVTKQLINLEELDIPKKIIDKLNRKMAKVRKELKKIISHQETQTSVP